MDTWLLAGVGATAALTVGALTWWMSTRPMRRTLRALEIGLADFHDGSFGRRIVVERSDSLGKLVALYNEVGETLRTERRRLVEREMLLESVLAQNPVAVVLRRDDDLILVANRAAERQLNRGYRLAGKALREVAQAWPDVVREAFENDTETVFEVAAAPGSDDDSESFHLSNRRFTLNGREHRLHAMRRLTPELRRQEVAVWKRVIRTISHEINNTLAPISSLAHSAKLLHRAGDRADQLDEVLDTIGESAARLRDFIAGYARFARLPDPDKREHSWDDFLRELGEVAPFGSVTATADSSARFDAAQLQQVLINLNKNAREAGSDDGDIELRIERLTDGRSLIRVRDRGTGMTDEQRQNALLPFYSTKRESSGLGLALCREIIEAHGGGIELAARDGGGTVVTLWLPAD